jgi:ABC-type transporter Mla MlaB component
MASNFQIFSNQNRDSLHLHMYGDFDGMSAYELINALKKQSSDYFEVFIDTSDLDKIHPFGLDVFKKQINRPTKNKRNLIFIGRHRHRFAA